jgi:hypothetical protein
VAQTTMVDIGLTAQTFEPGTATPKAKFISAITAMIARIAKTPSTLRLTYLLAGGEDQAGAVKRLRAAEDLIQRAWRGVGTYELQIEKSLQQE